MTVSHEQDEFAVESEDLSAGALSGVVAAIAAIVIMIVTLAVNITNIEFEGARQSAMEHTVYPMLENTRSAAAAKMSQTGAVAGEEGVYQIPIERAMELEVAERSSN